MADNAMFDQLKFYLGLGVFIYAVWSLYGAKLGIGAPPDFSLGGGPPAAPAKSNIGLYWGRPWRDSALPWSMTDFGENNPMKRLTVA